MLAFSEYQNKRNTGNKYSYWNLILIENCLKCATQVIIEHAVPLNTSVVMAAAYRLFCGVTVFRIAPMEATREIVLVSYSVNYYFCT